eukprot:TRINITY_DN15202_c0_g1_i1.p1 TRINITY_DN15202_c0_g1~~TRINITY_DN15202_c0_g1_i1.p1  ORF type:complete len:221 (+),score=12.89 TRINITY_DN15202_c0_g1_i1:61-663(+)
MMLCARSSFFRLCVCVSLSAWLLGCTCHAVLGYRLREDKELDARQQHCMSYIYFYGNKTAKSHPYWMRNWKGSFVWEEETDEWWVKKKDRFVLVPYLSKYYLAMKRNPQSCFTSTVTISADDFFLDRFVEWTDVTNVSDRSNCTLLTETNENNCRQFSTTFFQKTYWLDSIWFTAVGTPVFSSRTSEECYHLLEASPCHH